MINSTYQFINLDYLNLMTDGDTDMKKLMLEMLFEELPTEVEKMKKLQTAQNWEELKAVSHKMKSTLAFIGNPQLTNANKEVEQIARHQHALERLPQLLRTLEQLYPKTMDELRLEYDQL